MIQHANPYPKNHRYRHEGRFVVELIAHSMIKFSRCKDPINTLLGSCLNDCSSHLLIASIIFFALIISGRRVRYPGILLDFTCRGSNSSLDIVSHGQRVNTERNLNLHLSALFAFPHPYIHSTDIFLIIGEIIGRCDRHDVARIYWLPRRTVALSVEYTNCKVDADSPSKTGSGNNVAWILLCLWLLLVCEYIFSPL